MSKVLMNAFANIYCEKRLAFLEILKQIESHYDFSVPLNCFCAILGESTTLSKL